MRKTQKKQAQSCVELLAQAHDEIRKAIERRKDSLALGLLEQCQETAIELGTMIEQAEGEGFAAVSLLEEYCEVVYRIYENFQQTAMWDRNRVSKSLKRSLTRIKNSIKTDIKIHTEAVFLPYKASMWDSLESIWRAADEDPDCDAYVIPIPYYDRNPDGSFREEHYEGELYPEDVPVTRYQEYDFAERRPDIVFIHNPYDDENYVTSVHPFFYARNLKQYTDQLVYVPYFVLNEIDPEDQAAVKGMEHFCTVPGVVHADKVIVQSEAMRQVYVNVMTDYARASGAASMDRKYWEEKILGTGSPKMDKVQNTQREDLTIPDEWRRVIERPDGSRRKVIFYNTSVTAFLQHGGKYLRKMRDVFRIFYENREEIALLWRPHPLMEATVKSMRPELGQEYGEIVEEYKDAGWGIYDDTAELERAVALCDGYYGDGSSVVQLCRARGVPVMVQDVDTAAG